jgi:hypothetical protein
MNIFEILCYGDGRVNEPQMSSVLAFILDPSAAHGYKHRPLSKFINIFFEQGKSTFTHLGLNDKKNIHKWLHSFKLISLDLELISRNEDSKKRSDLDLVIRFYKDATPEFIIIIENKINDGASRGNKNQLTQQYSSLKKEINSQIETLNIIKKIPIIFVYLTPKPVTNPKMASSLKQWNDFKLEEKPTKESLRGSEDEMQRAAWREWRWVISMEHDWV